MNPISATNLTMEGDPRNLFINADPSVGIITFTSDRHAITSKPMGTLVAEESPRSTDANPRIRVNILDDEGNVKRVVLRNKRAFFLFKEISGGAVVRISTAGDRATMVTEVVNYLNGLFNGASSGSSATGDAPVITSSLTPGLTTGETLNYELIASNGVGYEWDNLPSGVVTVEGNVRKLIGGSSLLAGTYPITAKAINYFGQDSQTINLTVSDPPFNNTKSVKFQGSSNFLGVSDETTVPIFNRSSNGSGASDGWSVSMWFKPNASGSGQTLIFAGNNSDIQNGGHLEFRFIGGNDRLRLRYGTTSNYLQLQTGNDSVPAGSWIHILLTYDGGTTGSSSADLADYFSRFKIYLNGSVASTITNHSNYGYTGSVTASSIKIGRYVSGNALGTDAFVDEVALWDSNQSSNISSIYNGGTPFNLSSLNTPPNHWWRMGDGDTFPNLTDNGEDAVAGSKLIMNNLTAANIVTDAP